MQICARRVRRVIQLPARGGAPPVGLRPRGAHSDPLSRRNGSNRRARDECQTATANLSRSSALLFGFFFFSLEMLRYCMRNTVAGLGKRWDYSNYFFV